MLQKIVVTDQSGGRSQPVVAGCSPGERTATPRLARAWPSTSTWRAAVAAHPSAWNRDDVGAETAVEVDRAASIPPATPPATPPADAGMSTVEYAVGTVVAAAFAAVLYKIVTGDSVVAGLTNLINSALSTTF